MTTLTIRGCDEKLSAALKSESRRRGMSINKLVIATLEESFVEEKKRRFNGDLDHLAGTWSTEDLLEFERNTRSFSEIDAEEWK